tara:strand:+ start:801 stop:1739 length:939 start_codon:yes stop_codon:yes gene_type:complete
MEVSPILLVPDFNAHILNSVEIETYLDEQRARVDAALKARMPAEDTRPDVIHKAMCYSVFNGGKRLRPILCLAAAEAAGAAGDAALMPGLAIELLHTYTLVHDDLPCMDDDDLRRGQPTSHVVFGQANAVLAGDALQTLAFEWAAEQPAPGPYAPGAFVTELAQAAGSQGVVGGQVEDLAAEGTRPSAETLYYIHKHKTALLFRAATRMGAIAAGAGEKALAELDEYGLNIGLAFQIADDVLNATSTAAVIGKPAGSDAEREKLTCVAVHGLDRSREMAAQFVQTATQVLKAGDCAAEPLLNLADYIIQRTH